MIRNDEYQLEISQRICDAISSGKKNIVLEAPTGSGKSGMAWFTHKLSNLSTAVLSHQKILQDQYNGLLGNLDYRQFLTLKGQNNYKCNLNNKVTVDFAECSSNNRYKCFMKAKKQCTYWRLREEAKTSNFLNMNYQQMYLLYDNNPLNEEEFVYKKDLFIFDECHNFGDLYTDLRTVEISSKTVEKLKSVLSVFDEDDYGSTVKLVTSLIKFYNHIDYKKAQNNVLYGLSVFNSVFKLITELSTSIYDIILKDENELIEKGKIGIYVKFAYLLNTWRTKYSKLDNFGIISSDKYVIEHVYDNFGNILKFIPLDISGMFNYECNDLSKYRLFMSSTIFGAEKYIKSLGLDLNESEFIHLDSKFPVDNRPVFYMPFKKMNKKVTDNISELKDYFSKITAIVLDHASKGDSGVIFVPSYGLVKSYIDLEYKKLADNNVKLLYNLKSEERDSVIEAFYNLKDKQPKLLISPSFSEGVNFENDISRYQIIMKIPYGNLGSKYIKTKMDIDPIGYQLKALTDVVQSVGRSIRNKEDYAVTYITDMNWSMLYNKSKRYIPKWFDDSINSNMDWG